jgi:hypothetical protein
MVWLILESLSGLEHILLLFLSQYTHKLARTVAIAVLQIIQLVKAGLQQHGSCLVFSSFLIPHMILLSLPSWLLVNS